MRQKESGRFTVNLHYNSELPEEICLLARPPLPISGQYMLGCRSPFAIKARACTVECIATIGEQRAREERNFFLGISFEKQILSPDPKLLKDPKCLSKSGELCFFYASTKVRYPRWKTAQVWREDSELRKRAGGREEQSLYLCSTSSTIFSPFGLLSAE